MIYKTHNEPAQLLFESSTWHTKELVYESRVLSNNLLKEGITEGLLGDVIELIVAGAAEYGIDFVTAGAGAAAGSAVEVFISSLFGVKAVASAIDAVKNIVETMQEFSALIKKAMSLSDSLRDDFDGFYENIKDIVSRFLSVMGTKMGGSIKKAAKKLAVKLRAGLDKLIKKLTDALVKGVKMIIPDAAIGAAVGVALRGALSAGSSNMYTVLTKAIELSKDFKEFLLEPGKAVEFFSKLSKDIIKAIQAMSKKIQDESWISTLTSGGLAGAAIKKMGPSGLSSIASQIKSFMGTFSKVIEQIVSTVIPAMFSCAAIFQIIEKEEYEVSEVKQKSKKDKDEDKDKEEQKSEALIRNFVKLQLNEMPLVKTDVSRSIISLHGNSRKKSIRSRPGNSEHTSA